VLVILSQLWNVLKVLRRLGDESTLLEVLLLVGQAMLMAELGDLGCELFPGQVAQGIDDPAGLVVSCCQQLFFKSLLVLGDSLGVHIVREMVLDGRAGRTLEMSDVAMDAVFDDGILTVHDDEEMSLCVRTFFCTMCK
jgi:hypothetical protein